MDDLKALTDSLYPRVAHAQFSQFRWRVMPLKAASQQGFFDRSLESKKTSWTTKSWSKLGFLTSPVA